MADIITYQDLVDVPGLSATEGQRTYAARRASNLVASKWVKPVDDAPQWVKDIAIDVATRYLANPRGVTSYTRSVDDASRTERFENGARGGFYLTAGELEQLCPTMRRRVGSARLSVPGYQP